MRKLGIYFLIVTIAFLIARIYLFEIHDVLGNSMQNTLQNGDKILVCKTCSAERSTVMVFKKNGIDYIKRCVGLPGDTIQIINGRTCINGRLTTPPTTVLLPDILLDGKSKRSAKKKECFDYQSYRTESDLDQPVYNYFNSFWTRNNFGPFVLPRKGMSIKIDSSTLQVYQNIFKEELSLDPSKNLDAFMFENGIYVFKRNYYFFLGDNRDQSNDSRILGPVSENMLIGVASRILYSSKPRNVLTKIK
jgi:signal peptidase I